MNHYEQYIVQILDGRYRINALLGVGGMAAVLVAKDLKTNRNVAIKMLKEDLSLIHIFFHLISQRRNGILIL